MESKDLQGILTFLRESERLKNIFRSSHTSLSRRESVAEHSWRLCLMALVLEPYFSDIDMSRVIKICIVHDLGEALQGDIPAPVQIHTKNKSESERKDLLKLTESLPALAHAELLGLWDEYENASTDEGRMAKALDKLETIMQHNQGENPDDFDYAYNLDYGKKYTSDPPIIASIREILDEETRQNAEKSD